jgi:hypothetical protein
MNKKRINYLTLSDIHLGHNNNPTDNITNNIISYFTKYKNILIELDILYIAGDLFDRLLTASSNEYKKSIFILTFIAKFCKSHNIKLRILEGTPSHDWKQMDAFHITVKELVPDVDFKYISTLSIELMEDLGISVLYIPDEWRHHSEDVYDDVLACLKEHNLAAVDTIIMHGQFHYQIPNVILPSSHIESNYTAICKHYISIGHIHSKSVYGKIVAQGSFDRLAHNEEEAKGGMWFSISDTEDDEFSFLENDNAMVFVTIDCRDILELESLIEFLDTKLTLDNYKESSHIRLYLRNDEKILDNINNLSKRYFMYKLTIKKDKNEDKVIETKEEVEIESFSITPHNIEELLLDEMKNYIKSDYEIEIFKRELERVR